MVVRPSMAYGSRSSTSAMICFTFCSISLACLRDYLHPFQVGDPAGRGGETRDLYERHGFRSDPDDGTGQGQSRTGAFLAVGTMRLRRRRAPRWVAYSLTWASMAVSTVRPMTRQLRRGVSISVALAPRGWLLGRCPRAMSVLSNSLASCCRPRRAVRS